MKIVKKKSNENCHFTAVKNRCILHGRVFVMQRVVLHLEIPGVSNKNSENLKQR